MKIANSKDFIGIICEDKPAMIFFHYKDEENDAKKIKAVLKELHKDFPLLSSYEYIIDDNDDNLLLAQHLDVSKTPILVFYKDGCFNRYKDKYFNKKTLGVFIGSKRLYGKPAKEKETKQETTI